MANTEGIKNAANDSCIILVPARELIERPCEKALSTLEERGFEVRRVFGQSVISWARSRMATQALSDGFDELMWIDADIVFNPDDVQRLRSHNLPIVGGVYPKKGGGNFAWRLSSGKHEILLGKGGGVIPVIYIGTGFLYTQRIVYEKIAEHFKLPQCLNNIVPYFDLTSAKLPSGGMIHLTDDYSFCERASQCGFKIMADAYIRLEHIGKYIYSWEDVVARERVQSFRLHINQE